MSSSSPKAARAALTANDVARLVEHSMARGGVIDQVMYIEHSDVLALHSGHFAVLIDRDFISEFRGLPSKKLKQITLSAGGTSIELEKYDIHIEGAGLLADYFNHLRMARAGDPVLELLDSFYRDAPGQASS
jgi:hypothetical protein